MASTTPNVLPIVLAEREEIQVEITRLLEVFFQDKIAKAYDYLPSSMGGRSPVVATYMAGTGRERAAAGRRVMRSHRCQIYTYALYSLPNSTVFTEKSAQKALNKLSDGLDEFIKLYNYHEGFWMSLEFEEFSVVDVMKIPDGQYFMEVTPIRVNQM